MYVYKPTSKSLKCVHKPSVSSGALQRPEYSKVGVLP